MSYLVLARKWRPQTFDEVVGQPHVTKTLQNAIQLHRIAHAYLFTGARGVGKTSVARILAKTLNCERDLSPVPCNSCSNCREITQGNAVDVIEIDGASNRGIDSIRELRETVRYRPAKSRYKIYIIDEVHMLTTEAFNALLKTLEEPPEHVLFIFATTEPHKIPSTILSRCQRFDFRRIPIQQILKHLKDIVREEGVALSEMVLYSVAREADGSMRDAQSLLEQLLSFSGDGLADEEVLDVLGVVDRRSVHRMGDAVLSGDVRTCLDVVGDLYRRGIDSRRFCQQLCDHFRNLLFWALGAGEGAAHAELPEEEQRLLVEQLGKTTPESLYLYFQMILKGEEEIRRSTLPRIALEMLLLRLTQLPRLEALEGVLEKLDLLEKNLRGDSGCILSEAQPTLAPVSRVAGRSVDSAEVRPDPGAKAPTLPLEGRATLPAAAVPAAELDSPVPRVPQTGPATDPPKAADPVPRFAPDDVMERWPTFLQRLHTNDPILAAKLNQSRPVSVSEGTIELEILDMFQDAIHGNQTLEKLTDSAAEFFGTRFQWVIRGRPSLRPEPKDSQKPKQSRTNLKRLVMEHAVVQQALEILGGELIDIRHLGTDPAVKEQKDRLP